MVGARFTPLRLRPPPSPAFNNSRCSCRIRRRTCQRRSHPRFPSCGTTAKSTATLAPAEPTSSEYRMLEHGTRKATSRAGRESARCMPCQDTRTPAGPFQQASACSSTRKPPPPKRPWQWGRGNGGVRVATVGCSRGLTREATMAHALAEAKAHDYTGSREPGNPERRHAPQERCRRDGVCRSAAGVDRTAWVCWPVARTRSCSISSSLCHPSERSQQCLARRSW